jgi:hypothetical protein
MSGRLSLGLLALLIGCGGDNGDAADTTGEESGSATTCVDGCIPDLGSDESTGSMETGGTETSTTDTDTTDATDTEATETTDGGGCPANPADGEACDGKLACQYGEGICCLCDPDMGCDTWTCAPPIVGVFCPQEHPGVGTQCPMEAISCSYCIAEDPALMCIGGEWSPMLWCF